MNTQPGGVVEPFTEEQEKEELALVMREIAEAMQARAAVLTLHPADGANSVILVEDEAAGVGADRLAPLISSGRLWPNWDRGDDPEWILLDDGVEILSIPVGKIPGHSRLVISAFFDDPDAQQRRLAENVYLSRRPFAVGYFRLWQQERTRRRRLNALEAALNLADFGVLLINRAGELAFANAAGQEILDVGDGLRQSRNTIRAAELADSVRLQVALDHVIGLNSDGGPDRLPERRAPMTTLRRPSKPPLFVAILPTERAAFEASDVAAIIYVLDPIRDMDHVLQPVCKLYSLSLVESRLASLLISGTPLREAAAQMRIKEQTARSYLKQIFAKTGANRQSELVRLMLSSIVRVFRGVRSEVL